MTSPTSSDSPLSQHVRANLAEVRRRIESRGVDPDRVSVVAITKTFDATAVRAAYGAGITRVGENYLDELESKRHACADLTQLEWQYVGAIQSRKIPRLLECADVIATLARPKEIDLIAQRRDAARVMIQVDTTTLAQRNGATLSEVPGLVASARSNGLIVEGLMTVAPQDPHEAQATFRALARLASELDLTELSMGMSDDFELAVSEGATQIRLGRLLFGPRTPRFPVP
jgi:pyridoxal phosphate enzyme (YggS family)